MKSEESTHSVGLPWKDDHQAPAAGRHCLRGSAAAAAPTLISYRTFHYTCLGNKKISVSYVNYGKDGPMFAVLNWNGQQYGLAQAVSGSGARYASLDGPTVSGGGLEWWEHQGQATLNTFVGTDTRNTRPLLTNCKTGVVEGAVADQGRGGGGRG